MTSVRVNASMPADVYEKMEQARGDVSRSKFITRAVEGRLSMTYPDNPQVQIPKPPAPTRAPSSAETKAGVKPRPKAGKR